MRIGLLYETREQLMAPKAAREETHYHWREPEEVTAVEAALRQRHHRVERLIGVNALLSRRTDSPARQLDLVMNLSVRALSRSRTAIAPALLEQLGLPYTGADAAAKALALNKDWLKPLLAWAGIPTPAWRRYEPGSSVESLPPWPVSILKPVCEGYSLGLERFQNSWGLGALRRRVARLQAAFGAPVLCEERIAGRELTLGVVGNGGAGGYALVGAVETVDADGQPMGERLLDLEAKRRGGFHRRPADLDQPCLQPLRASTLRLMELLGPMDYATLDFRIDGAGRPHLLDLNPDATLHPDRSLAMVAAHAGLAYPDLIEAIVAACRHRHGFH
jgi:D-alanine-D-alanine ligase